MTKEERIELVNAAVSKLEEVSKLLTTAGEELLADQVDELADLVDIVAIPERRPRLRRQRLPGTPKQN
jgi:hypothetical protein